MMTCRFQPPRRCVAAIVVVLLWSIFPAIAAELHFNLLTEALPQRSLIGTNTTRRHLRQNWGQFRLGDDFCVQKVPNPQDSTSHKVRFLNCDMTEPDQKWKFEKGGDFNYYGLLYNQQGGCLVFRGKIRKGKKLRVVECDTSNPKQHWFADGDYLSPLDYNEVYCVSSVVNHYIKPIQKNDPVVLQRCPQNSLDY